MKHLLEGPHDQGDWRHYEIFGVAVASNEAFRHLESTAPTEHELIFTRDRAAPREPVPVDVEPVYRSPYRTRRGEPASSLYRLGARELMRFHAVDFYLQADRIDCHLHDPDDEHLVKLRLLGPVFSYWLECRGVRTLHAAAIGIDGRAVGFLSGSRGGKTSLAAQLMKAGHSLLTDDVLAVEENPGGFSARPSYPQMRMWPAEAERFLRRHEGLELVHPAYRKRRVPVGGAGWGRFSKASSPLAVLYLPRRVADVGAGIAITSVSARDAVIELVRHSFHPLIVEAVGLQAERLDFFARLVRQVPVRRLEYPDGFEHLPEVAARISDDLAAYPP